MITKKELKETLERLGWGVSTDKKGRIQYIENFSPAGENLVIEFNENEREITDIIWAIKHECQNYDADEHAEMWVEHRGQNGVPYSIRELVDDADAIEEMYNNLLDAIEKLERK